MKDKENRDPNKGGERKKRLSKVRRVCWRDRSDFNVLLRRFEKIQFWDGISHVQLLLASLALYYKFIYYSDTQGHTLDTQPYALDTE